MIGGYPAPTPEAWAPRTATPIRNSTRTIARGSGRMPTSAETEDGVFACHRTPTDDNQHLVEEVSDARLVRARLATIQERLGHVRVRAVLCGHSHQQHLIQLPDGPLVLNPSSVGCSSYHDPGR
jgi:Icc-related predicted phosphoesterase